MAPAQLPRLLLLLAALVGAGCEGELSTVPPASSVEALRERRAARFALADFLKPRMDGPAELDPYFAPLIYLEAPHDAPLGAAFVDDADRLAVDADRPVVYCASDLVELAGSERRRLTFVWFRDLSTPRAQGIRLVLDRNGHPAIAEVLADDSGWRPVYVTLALEERATETFGPALPGRSFAIEGAPAEAHTIVLAGTVANPSAPLGPFVYQARGANDVTTVHCRCSPSQVDAFRESVEYELMPLQMLDGVWPREGDANFVPPELLERGLRLPAGF